MQIGRDIKSQDNARRELEIAIRNAVSLAAVDGLQSSSIIQALRGVLDTEISVKSTGDAFARMRQ